MEGLAATLRRIKDKKRQSRRVWQSASVEERERGNETLMETDRREGSWETQRQDANKMSSSFC